MTDYYQLTRDRWASGAASPSSIASLTFRTTPPTPAPEFKVGDKVNVKIDIAAVVEYASRSGEVDLTFPGNSAGFTVPTKFVTLADPVNWPPKPGQVWKVGSKNYGVRRYIGSATKVVLYPIDQNGPSYSDGNSTSHTLDDFKKLRPTLIG